MRKLVAAGAVVAAGVVAVVAVAARGGGAALPEAATSWASGAVEAGTARLVAPTGRGVGCGADTLAVAVRGGAAWASRVCPVAAGDESAPLPDPAYAVDALNADGTVRRLAVSADRAAPLTVEAVAPDGTL